MAIEWAIVPVAGKGTRMAPASAVVPKALLPVGVRPMLHWTLQEAVDAGIPGVVIIVSPDQDLVRAYVEAALEATGGGALEALGVGLAGMEIRWVVQPEPRGVGDAFMRCREITRDADFAVLLPDNWFDAEPAAIAQVAGTFEKTGLCTIGLTRVEPEEAHLFGNVGGVELEALGGDSFRIRKLQDKLPGTFSGREGGAALRGCARYVLDPSFYEVLTATGPPREGEWDDVPAFQRLVEGAGLAGHRIAGRHYDVGMSSGYLAAAAYLYRRRLSGNQR